MVTEDLFQEVKTPSSARQENVYSLENSLRHPEYLHDSGQETIEPFDNEREALDFANDYAMRLFHEAG